MALHTDLPIHKTGCKLLSLAVTAQVQMPRTVKRLMGDKITSHCIEMLDLMAMANASQKAERAALADIDAFLPSTLGVQLNPRKTILQPIERGIDFVGHVIKPWRRTTRPRTLRVAMQRIEDMPDADLFAAGNSYMGLLRQASHSHTDRTRLANALMARGHCVKSDITKIYRKEIT